MDALLQGLNDAQKSAVTSSAAVVQVLAPPGSGKTKTLTARVAYHINHERLQPWNIIVCTFTIKAAKEMKERIKEFVGDKLEAKLILGTFHSVSRRFLTRYGHQIGLEKNFGIADTSDSTAILKRIIKRHDYMVEPGHARSRISKLKSKGTSAEEFSKISKNVKDNEFVMVYSSYEEHLKASNLLDYDDLLLRCVQLLRQFPSCVSTIQAVLIDEYQDTNNIQYELMRLLAQHSKRITIVGDPDQSIYSFRAAEMKNLLRMRTDYPETTVINLENNYRSSGRILGSAMAVIEQDESRPPKPLVATHGVGEQPTLRHLVSANVEARWIVEEIHRTKTLTAGLLSYNDYAILLRSSPLSLQIERALGQAGIPYRMVAGTRFFDRVEIRILLDYLRVTSQTDHNDAVSRIINVPSRKIGDSTVKALLEEAEVRKLPLWNLVLDIAQGRRKSESKISAQAQKGIEQFVNIILTARQKISSAGSEDCNLLEIMSHILQKLQFEAYLKQAHKDNWQDRWANVEELVAQATQMATALADGEEISDDVLPIVEGLEQRPNTAADILSKFLANVTLSSSADQGGTDINQITISTIHAAKGLEWPVVFLPAVYDGSIPHSRADDYDEERRLLYVGMTRAQALLYLSCPVKQSGQEQTTLSRFVSESKIKKLFSGRGPDLAFNRSTIPDLARILRRPCPVMTAMVAAHTMLEHLEDDKYPITREELDGGDSEWNITSYDISRPSDSEIKTAEGGSRRRKYDAPSAFGSNAAPIAMHKSSLFSAVTTTMQAVKAGFTSARELGDFKALQQDADRIRTLSRTDAAQEGKSLSKKPKLVEARSAQGRVVKQRTGGQGAITSFFQRTGATPSHDEVQTTLVTPSLRVDQGLQTLPSNCSPLHDRSNMQFSGSETFPRLSKPSHKPQNQPILRKPKRLERENESESTRYVLLSSSPNRLGPEDTVPDGGKHSQAEGVLPSTHSSARTTNDFRPTSTMHTTTISQFRHSSAQRKTLGTRRTMEGWSVKHSAMPKPRST